VAELVEQRISIMDQRVADGAYPEAALFDMKEHGLFRSIVVLASLLSIIRCLAAIVSKPQSHDDCSKNR